MHIGQIEMRNCCGKCGGNDIIGPDDMTDESIVTCNTCGNKIGTWAEYKAVNIAAATKYAKEMLKGARIGSEETNSGNPIQ